jgi:hypothetical protein
VLGLSDAEVITGVPRSIQVASSGAAVSHHAGISVVAERQPSRMPALADDAFGGEELFKREPIPPMRASKTDSRV